MKHVARGKKIIIYGKSAAFFLSYLFFALFLVFTLVVTNTFIWQIADALSSSLLNKLIFRDKLLVPAMVYLCGFLRSSYNSELNFGSSRTKLLFVQGTIS